MSEYNTSRRMTFKALVYELLMEEELETCLQQNHRTIEQFELEGTFKVHLV